MWLLLLASVQVVTCATAATASRQKQQQQQQQQQQMMMSASSGPLELHLDASTATYTLETLLAGGSGKMTWLSSAPARLRARGGWVALAVANASASAGADVMLGRFMRLAVRLVGPGGAPQLEVGFRVYTAVAAAGVIVAEQTFVDGVEQVSLPGGASAADAAASAFPHWRVGAGLLGHGGGAGGDEGLHFLAGCDSVPLRGLWPAGWSSSFLGDGLPLALVHARTAAVLVM
jgi:hypothetical protein